MFANKKDLRKTVLKLRDALSVNERKEKSFRIAGKVIGMPEFQRSNVVLLYDAIRSEVDTTAILQEAKSLKKRIYYPRVIGDKMKFYLVEDATEFEISRFGIREPRMVDEKEFVPKGQDKILVLMPGVAYDEAGNRIGYGGGYYDKYLEWLTEYVSLESIYKVGIAFSCQMVELGVIEAELHDVKVDCVIRE